MKVAVVVLSVLLCVVAVSAIDINHVQKRIQNTNQVTGPVEVAQICERLAPHVADAGDEADILVAKCPNDEHKLLCAAIAKDIIGETVDPAYCRKFAEDFTEEEDDVKEVTKSMKGIDNQVRFGIEDEMLHSKLTVNLKAKKTAALTNVGYMGYAAVIAKTDATALDIPLISITADGISAPRSNSEKNSLEASYPGVEFAKDENGIRAITEIVTGPVLRAQIPEVFDALKLWIKTVSAKTEEKSCYANNGDCLPGMKDVSAVFSGCAVPISTVVAAYNTDQRNDKYDLTLVDPAPGADYEYLLLCNQKEPAGSKQSMQINYGLPLAKFKDTYFKKVMEDPFAIDTIKRCSKATQTYLAEQSSKGPSMSALADADVQGLFNLNCFMAGMLAYLDTYEEMRVAYKWKAMKASVEKNSFDQLPKVNTPDLARWLISEQQKALVKWAASGDAAAATADAYFALLDLPEKAYFKDLLREPAGTTKAGKVSLGQLRRLSKVIKATKTPKTSTKTYRDKFLTQLRIAFRATFTTTYTGSCSDRYTGKSAETPFGNGINNSKLDDDCSYSYRPVPVGGRVVVLEARRHTEDVQAFAVSQKVAYSIEQNWPSGMRTFVRNVAD